MTMSDPTEAAEQTAAVVAEVADKIDSTLEPDAAAEASREAGDDAWLEARVSGKSREEADAARKGAVEKSGSEDADASDPGADEDAETSGDEGDSSEGQTGESPLYLKAKKAIERLPKAMRKQLEGLDREQFLEAGLELAESQAEQDRIGNQLDQLKNSKDGQREEGEAAEDGGDKLTSEPSNKLDFSKVLEPLDPDMHGEELPQTLTALGNTLADHLEGKFTTQVNGLLEAFNEYAIDAARRQEMGAVPILRDAEAWTRVRSAMKELEPAMEYGADELLHSRMSKLISRALHAEFPKEMADLAAKQKGPKASSKRDAGQTEGAGRRAAPTTKPKTEEERQERWLEVRTKTGSRRKADEAAGYV